MIYDWFPAANFTLLTGAILVYVIVHLRRSDAPFAPPPAPQCLVTGESRCMVFDRHLINVELCEQCRQHLREKWMQQSGDI